MTSSKPTGGARTWRTPVLAAIVIALVAAGGVIALRAVTGPPAAERPPAASLAPPVPTASASPAPKASRSPNAPAVSVTSFGARPDDGGDDTAAILAALQATAGSETAAYAPAGVYDVDSLSMPRGARLLGDGAAHTWLKGGVELAGSSRMTDLKVGEDGRAFHLADGATDSLLLRVTFVGGGSMTSGAEQGVIRFGDGRSASHITFRDCVIGANSADGNGVSIVDNGWSGATYHHLTWERCRFEGSPRMTFECIQRDDDVHPFETGYSAIDLVDCVFEPSGSETVSYDSKYRAGRSRVSGCTFMGSGWNEAYPWGQGIEFNRVRDMRFVGNTVYRCRGAMINHSGDPGVPSRNVFRDNVFDATISHIDIVPEPDVQVIYYNGVDGARFVDNVVRTDVGGQLVYMSRSSDNVFDGDRFIDTRPPDRAFSCAWITDGSHGTRFSDCVFVSGAPAGCIVLHDGSTGTVVRNSTFKTRGATPVVATPGSTVEQEGNTYR